MLCRSLRIHLPLSLCLPDIPLFPRLFDSRNKVDLIGMLNVARLALGCWAGVVGYKWLNQPLGA